MPMDLKKKEKPRVFPGVILFLYRNKKNWFVKNNLPPQPTKSQDFQFFFVRACVLVEMEAKGTSTNVSSEQSERVSINALCEKIATNDTTMARANAYALEKQKFDSCVKANAAYNAYKADTLKSLYPYGLYDGSLFQMPPVWQLPATSEFPPPTSESAAQTSAQTLTTLSTQECTEAGTGATSTRVCSEAECCCHCEHLRATVHGLNFSLHRLEEDLKNSNALLEKVVQGLAQKDAEVRLVKDDGAKIPVYSTSGSAGADVYAHIPEAVVVRRSEVVKIPTGLRVEIPPGYEIQVRTRSSLAAKGVLVVNSPGTIDSDFRGEIHVLVTTLSDNPHTVQPNDRIAQLVLSRVYSAQFALVNEEELSCTARGEGGFGHTGQ